MQFENFVKYHWPALARNEIKYSSLLGVMERGDVPGLRACTMGGPGECAVQSPGRPLLLGNLNESQCNALAKKGVELDYVGVVGADETALRFVDRAIQLGSRFAEPIPLRVHALHERPRYPNAPGTVRRVNVADLDLFLEWTLNFIDEAMPNAPKPSVAQLERSIDDGLHFFWTVADKPVAMASISPRLKNVSAINAVYTPPHLRGQGFAGSVTAALADLIFYNGKASVCLYTDRRNPHSNRCYAKIGFVPICDLWQFMRVKNAGET